MAKANVHSTASVSIFDNLSIGEIVDFLVREFSVVTRTPGDGAAPQP